MVSHMRFDDVLISFKFDSASRPVTDHVYAVIVQSYQEQNVKHHSADRAQHQTSISDEIKMCFQLRLSPLIDVHVSS